MGLTPFSLLIQLSAKRFTSRNCRLDCVSGDVVLGVTAPAAAEMDLDFALQPGRRLAANQAAQFP